MASSSARITELSFRFFFFFLCLRGPYPGIAQIQKLEVSFSMMLVVFFVLFFFVFFFVSGD